MNDDDIISIIVVLENIRRSARKNVLVFDDTYCLTMLITPRFHHDEHLGILHF